jgi:hypothetical protein
VDGNVLAMLEESSDDGDLRPGLAFLAGHELAFEPAELNAARRRALFLLAAGGDPHREIELGDRAVDVLAAELDRPDRRAELVRGLESLQRMAEGLPDVSKALSDLLNDDSFAWRAYAYAALVEALSWSAEA